MRHICTSPFEDVKRGRKCGSGRGGRSAVDRMYSLHTPYDSFLSPSFIFFERHVAFVCGETRGRPANAFADEKKSTVERTAIKVFAAHKLIHPSRPDRASSDPMPPSILPAAFRHKHLP